MINAKEWCFRCMARLDAPGSICPKCGCDNAACEKKPGLLPSGVLAGQYIVGRMLGRGGFGITYIGMDAYLQRRVAIKEYFPAQLVARDPQTQSLYAFDEQEDQAFAQGRERAIEEGRVTAAIANVPSVVKVYNVVPANNTVYIIMEYIDGQTLKQRVLEMNGRMPWSTLFPLMKPIMRSLEQIHEHGVVHRDISPENIMLRREDGQAVLLDFGAAHVLSAGSNGEHSVSLRVGYAPAEQYSHTGEQSGRIDQYALCATLYFALTGRKPVDAQERMYGGTELLSPRSLGADVPEAVEQALLKGMAMRADDRYATIGELLSALEAAEKRDTLPQPPIDDDATLSDDEWARQQLLKKAEAHVNAALEEEKDSSYETAARAAPDYQAAPESQPSAVVPDIAGDETQAAPKEKPSKEEKVHWKLRVLLAALIVVAVLALVPK